jgi:hypothetical protein
MEDIVLEILKFSLPSLVTGLVAYALFKSYFDSDQRRIFLGLKTTLKKEVLSSKLQAYERLTLLLERIAPTNLLVRTPPISERRDDYEQLLIQTIEQEFDHNLSQQLYVSEECWTVILTAKSATVQMIRTIDSSNKVDSASKLREVILTHFIDKRPPSDTALSFLKNEAKSLLNQ